MKENNVLKKEKQLKKAIRLLGFSQSDLAKKFKVTRATVNNWITGNTFIPPNIVIKLKEMGIASKVLENPSKLI